MDIYKIGAWVTILVSATSWMVSNYAERVLNTPTLVYSVEEAGNLFSDQGCAGQSYWKLHLENISLSDRFPPVKIVIRPRPSATADQGLLVKNPMCQGVTTTTGSGEIPRANARIIGNQIQLAIPTSLVPGTAVEFGFSTQKASASGLHISFLPQFTYEDERLVERLRIMESGAESFILKNEFKLICLFVILLFGCGIWALAKARPNAKSNAPHAVRNSRASRQAGSGGSLRRNRIRL